MSTLLSISQIRIDGATQPRMTLNEEVLTDYRQVWEADGKFPPVKVVFDGRDHWLYDGFHRVESAKRATQSHIEADVQPGDLAMAQWLSFSANKIHGLRRSNEDKQRAVRGALASPLGKDKSDRLIAEHCGVDQKTVSLWRSKLASTEEIPQLNARTGKDGIARDASKISESNKARVKDVRTVIEEHEEPSEEDASTYVLTPQVAEVTRDRLGAPVPDLLLPFFDDLPQLLELIRKDLIHAQVLWNNYVKLHPELVRARALITAKAEIERLHATVHSLHSAKPYCICVYCHGERPECLGCGGVGWIAEDQYERAPAHLKQSAA